MGICQGFKERGLFTYLPDRAGDRGCPGRKAAPAHVADDDGILVERMRREVEPDHLALLVERFELLYQL